MFDWLTQRGSTTKVAFARVVPRLVDDDCATVGEYKSLHKYLRDRFANRD